MYFTVKPGNYPEINGGSGPNVWYSFRTPQNGGVQLAYTNITGTVAANAFGVRQGFLASLSGKTIGQS